MSEKYRLPSKVTSYLRRLEVGYERSDNEILSEIIQNARVYVHEATVSNWHSGKEYNGHDIFLFLNLAVLSKIELNKQSFYCEKVMEDLNSLNAVMYEFINGVHFELEDMNDPDYQESVPMKREIQPDPDTLSFWKSGQIRLFISHRDKHKKQAKILANELGKYGISAFVAHDTIQPMTTWQEEIMKGLQTMEVMLAFITDGFADSWWTNQEVGFALGRDIPIIPLKLQGQDPTGFIGNKQALRGSLENPAASISEIYKLMIESIGEERCKNVLIGKFLTSHTWKRTEELFKLIEESVSSLSDSEADKIIHGFSENSQLYDSFHLQSNLCNFLKRMTNKNYVIRGQRIYISEQNNKAQTP